MRLFLFLLKEGSLLKINLPQSYFSKLMRAVVECEMIDGGDRILIGVSGGKAPCYTCACFRRGSMNRFATEHVYNKIAYAHHIVDAV